MPQRLAIILSHPIQYYSPWFRWLSAHTQISLRVFYLWDAGVSEKLDPQFGTLIKWDRDLLAGYENEFVANTSENPGSDRFNGLKNPELTARIVAWSADFILIFGYKYHTHLNLIIWARLHRLPLIFRGDSHLLGRTELAWWKRIPLMLLYRQFSAILATGSANSAYFNYFGVPKDRLFLSPHSVDASHFTPTAEVCAEAKRLREHLRLSKSSRVVLFAGKFVPAKQPVELLNAFLKLHCPKTVLIFVGDGEERERLTTLATSAAPGSVHFLPFANQSEMPARYLLADLFVLPSRGNYETWGLAINEAMHMGVPCLVSNRVGCQQDLVTDGKTGWVFDSEDPQSLPNKLNQALVDLASPAHQNRIKTAVLDRISHYTYAQTTKGLQKALSHLRLRK